MKHFSVIIVLSFLLQTFAAVSMQLEIEISLLNLSQEEREAGMGSDADPEYKGEMSPWLEGGFKKAGYLWDDERLAGYFIGTTMNWYIRYLSKKYHCLPDSVHECESEESNTVESCIMSFSGINQNEFQYFDILSSTTIVQSLKNNEFNGGIGLEHPSVIKRNLLFGLFPEENFYCNVLMERREEDGLKNILSILEQKEGDNYELYLKLYKRMNNGFLLGDYLKKRSLLVKKLGARLMLYRTIATNMQGQLIINLDNNEIQNQKVTYYKTTLEIDGKAEYIHQILFTFLDAVFSEARFDDSEQNFTVFINKICETEEKFLQHFKLNDEETWQKMRPIFTPLDKEIDKK